MGCCCSTEEDVYSTKRKQYDQKTQSTSYSRVNVRGRGSEKESQKQDILYVAMWEYEKSSGAELSFVKGEIFKEVGEQREVGPEWLFVTRQKKSDKQRAGRKSTGMGSTGYVPRSYVAPVGSLEAQAFWFGDISRVDTEILLQGCPEGTFVIRGRETEFSGIVAILPWVSEMLQALWPNKVRKRVLVDLSRGSYDGRVRHYRIHAREERHRKLYFVGTTSFQTIVELVQHFRTATEGGLCCVLTSSPPKPPPPKSVISAEIEKHWQEIPRRQIHIESEIGKGFYGVVYKGTWEPATGTKLRVAVKELKRGITGQDEFLAEAITMKNLRHEHLVKLIGVVSADEPFCIITEFVKDGSLRNYLRRRAKEKQLLSEAQLVEIARQVADGMSYLEDQNIVHRDLAARNVLIEEVEYSPSGREKLSATHQKFDVKIADFGLAHMIKSGDAMKEERSINLPTKWTAPEALTIGTFSSASDVWSFGILLHEIFTHGREPYEGMSTAQTRTYVLEEKRQLQRAPEMPEKIYQLLASCCDQSAAARPTFKAILEHLEKYYEKERHYDQYRKR